MRLSASQFEQAAVEVLKEHYANTEGGDAQDVKSVQVMLQSSTPLVQSKVCLQLKLHFIRNELTHTHVFQDPFHPRPSC